MWHQPNMSDALLSSPDREEALSRAYASAIAAGAGYITYQPDFDRDSVDLVFGAGGGMRPKIDAQLKATINLRKKGQIFKLRLKKKNYDDLRAPTQVPRIVVVLALPRKDTGWLNVSGARLIIRRCAFWMSLRGLPDLPLSQESVTVDIPATNIFDVDGLKTLMAMAR